jgi:4-hydroxy-tetrahydrodipicolinate reductase
MKIIISGYGRMGKRVEALALQQNHEIVSIIDKPEDFLLLKSADVAIDFSLPEAAPNNIIRFIDNSIPVVVGTTGWYERLQEIKHYCCEKKGSLLYGSNMSIGMNLFFALNKKLAKLMHPYPQYRISVEETHHIHKKDAPSGTAITIVEDILQEYNELLGWELNGNNFSKKIPVAAIREGETVGKHGIIYNSDIDEISIQHNAFNRDGFALGALTAAKWLSGKRGVFTMEDVLDLRDNV